MTQYAKLSYLIMLLLFLLYLASYQTKDGDVV